MIKEYRLFSEWRNRVIYGETLMDAVARAGRLQRPDKFADGKISEEGEWVTIKKSVQIREHNSTRGSTEFESIIFEADDGRYLDVDAQDVTAKTEGNRVF